MQYGEILQLGPHRLMCGDATKAEDVHKLVAGERVNLVLTDPPYGIDIVRSGTQFKHHRPICNDTSTTSARLHYPIARALCSRLIFWGGQYFADFLPPMKGWLVWDKQHSPKNYADGELAWSTVAKTLKIYHHRWDGFIRAGSKRFNPSPSIHPTQKPVELHARILEDFSAEGDTILDCFGGSGTTLIACEITNRTCFMMELSPDYCDVVINRFNTLMKGSLTYGI